MTDRGTTRRPPDALPTDPRTAAEQALADAVLAYLRATGQVPKDRDTTVDFGVPFTARWVTSGGRTSRRVGTIIPTDGPDLDALGDMMLRRTQQIRLNWHDRWTGFTVEDEPITRHAYIPGCVADHSADPPDSRRCWVHVGNYGSTTRRPNALSVWAHQVTTPAGTQTLVRYVVGSTASNEPRMVADLSPSEAHEVSEDTAAAVERMTWAEAIR